MSHRIAAIALILVMTLACALSCGRSSSTPPAPEPAAPAPGALPPLSDLHAPATDRTVSAADYELLTSLPVMITPGGDHTSGGPLTLDASAEPGGMSFAIFALSGFPTDGSVVPQAVRLEKSNRLCWIAVANFASGLWELTTAAGIAPQVVLTPGASYLSGAGTIYVAVVGYPSGPNPDGRAEVDSIVVSASDPLPGSPVAVLNRLSPAVASHEVFFDAAGSTGGDSAIESITYAWDDGSPDTVETDPLAEVSHVFAAAGSYVLNVIIRNVAQQQTMVTLDVEVAEPFRELLLVFNSSIPASADLAGYYASARDGRAIDPACVIGLPLGDNADVDLARADYNSLLRDPVKSFLDASGPLKDGIRYILLVKGVPHRITDTHPSSVDSELCLLYADLGPTEGGYPYTDWLVNDPQGLVFGGDGFYLQGDADFVPNTYQVCYDPTWQQPDSGDEQPYLLSYLVGRLSAYTYDEAKLLVDRSLAADKTGSGWIILDSRPGTYGQVSDTMVDPVWPYTVDTLDCGFDLLDAAGFNAFQEITNELMVRDHASMPAGSADAVLAYCSWGVHSGHQRGYILDDLQFNWLPGACFMSYESFNAWNFNGDNLGNHAGQGQICDFIRMGGTCAIGNCWEPYTIGVGDERWVYDRYINHGDRWIEAAYKGLRLLSWQEVVVGDPLCQVK